MFDPQKLVSEFKIFNNYATVNDYYINSIRK